MPEQIMSLLRSLNTALRQLTFYPHEHPICRTAIEEAFQKARTALKNEELITVGIAGDTMISQGHPLSELGKQTETLRRALLSRDAYWFTFGHDLASAELERWLLHLRSMSPPEERDAPGQWAGSAIRMGGHESAETTAELDRSPENSIVAEFSDWLRIGEAPGVKQMRAAMKQIANELDSDELPLAIVEDALDTHQYLVRRGTLVALTSMALGRRVGIERSMLYDIGLAGLFCDIGLRGVSDQLLASKHGDPIDADVWNQHPTEGARILVGAEAPSISIVVVSEHHWGLSYASKTRHAFSAVAGIADDIIGRILGGYGNPGHRLDTALTGLAREGDHYPMELIWELFQMSGSFTKGSRVRLSNKKRAVIERMNPNAPLRPRVTIDEPGIPEQSCDLSEAPSGPFVTALVVD